MFLEKLSQFFAMGGYGFYVWSAYGVTFALLFIPLIKLFFLKKKVEKNASSL